MDDKNRYWDVDRCAWVAHEAATPALAATEALGTDLPEQRGDETAPAAAPSATR